MNQQTNISAGNPNWKPGVSGNPAGRPPGSRQKIAEALLKDIAGVWERRGAEVLERLANDDPAALAKIAFGLLPREALIAVQQVGVGSLSPSAWSALQRVLDLIEKCQANGEAEDVFAMIEEDLRARNARPIFPPLPPCPVEIPR